MIERSFPIAINTAKTIQDTVKEGRGDRLGKVREGDGIKNLNL